MTKNECYANLKLNPNQPYTDAELKAAYRRACMIAHPDRKGGSEASFRKVQQSYERILKNDFDETAYQRFASFHTTRTSVNNDFKADYELTRVRYEEDRIYINLPLSAIYEGTKVKVKGSKRGSKDHHFIIEPRLRPGRWKCFDYNNSEYIPCYIDYNNSKFTRMDYDIHCSITISKHDAYYGGIRKLKGLCTQGIVFKIPERSKESDSIVLRGMGFSSLAKTGDLIIKLKIDNHSPDVRVSFLHHIKDTWADIKRIFAKKH